MKAFGSRTPVPGRRRFLRTAAAFGFLEGFRRLAPAYAATNYSLPELRVGGDRIVDLTIDRSPFGFDGRHARAIMINGTIPGPILRFREGETATLRVTNRLDEVTSLHWHGILIPSEMDGVPGVSFPGISPGETFTYRFPVRQSGTYWYHSHSSLQEQQGMYAPIIMDPIEAEPFAYDREYVVVLSDWTFRDPYRVLSQLKKRSGYFNFQQRTLGDFFRDAKKNGFRETLAERAMWARMRMNPTDILDVTGALYTFLVNGLPPDANWTGLFKPGETVRLRFINSAADTNFNVRIPDLPMTVVSADGQNIEPVETDEFQIAIAETYDVIVNPQSDRAYTVFSEAVDRSGYGRGTLAPRAGMAAAVPALRERPLRTMVDMGMDMKSMNMPAMGQKAKPDSGKMPSRRGMKHGSDGSAMPEHDMKSMPDMQKQGMPMDDTMGSMPDMQKQDMPMDDMQQGSMPGMNSPVNGKHGPGNHGSENQAVAMVQRNRLGERGVGLDKAAHRVLVYTDLRALKPSRDPRPPERDLEIHLTGNMEAFIWGMDGRKFSESGPPPAVRVGERMRITLVNDTMMDHPMHLHGVFMEIVNGAEPAHQPRKHTINVKPAERLLFDFTYDEPGNFAFHCHILYHMEMGMFRFVNVSGQPQRTLT